MITQNLETCDKVVIKSIDRKYYPIWNTVAEKAAKGDFTPTVVQVPGLTDSVFRTIRKAFVKEKDIDDNRGRKYRAKICRGIGENIGKIYFSVQYKNIADRI